MRFGSGSGLVAPIADRRFEIEFLDLSAEGGLIFGLTAALHSQITIAKGRVQQSNFNDYRMMRINEAPAIEVHVIESDAAPGGIGEPAQWPPRHRW